MPGLRVGDAADFAYEWERLWNAHDIDGLLEYFDEDVTFVSPTAAKLVPASKGKIIGRAALKEYWLKGIAVYPGLRFSIQNVFAGIGVIAIHFSNERGASGCDFFVLQDERIVAGYGMPGVPR